MAEALIVTRDRLVADILDYVEARDEAISTISIAIFKSPGMLTRIVSGNKDPRLSTVERIYAHMKANPPDRGAAARRRKRAA